MGIDIQKCGNNMCGTIIKKQDGPQGGTETSLAMFVLHCFGPHPRYFGGIHFVISPILPNYDPTRCLGSSPHQTRPHCCLCFRYQLTTRL